MTHHVRASYRHHRKATLGVATVLAVAIAAIVIPLANAAEKTYTLTVNPSTLCANASGGASTVVTLRNTGSPQTAGSAQVYFPAGSVQAVSGGGWQLSPSSTSPASNGTKDIVARDNLNMAPNQTRTVTVTFKITANFSTAVTAALKQSNQFNDSSGTANLFTVQGGFPTLRVVQCVTVSGRVFQDRNLDFGYVTGDGAFDNHDLPKEGWTVQLFTKAVGAASYASPPRTAETGDEGVYTFTGVPTLADYKICVVASADDNGSKWGLQSPTGNAQCGPISSVSNAPSTSPGKLLPNLAGPASSPATDFQVVPVVGPFGQGDSSTVGGYTVIAGSNPGQKPDQFYVQDTWVDDQGRTVYRFSPILPCAAPQDCSKKIFLLEELTADLDLDDLAGQQAELVYDDDPPFLDSELKPMPYCNVDPRQAGGNLATTGVLPGTDTSCIVTGQQTVVAGGNVHVVYQVYTAYDGGRRIG